MVYRFNRMEVSGALGDLGTMLPLAVPLIVVNGMDPTGVLFMIGFLYVSSGAYYKSIVPVQPMKIIAAYAIALRLPPGVIVTSSLLMGILLLAMAASGLMEGLSRIPVSVVKGVQLAVGAILIVQGAEAVFTHPSIGLITLILALLLLRFKGVPVALLIVLGGVILGAAGLDSNLTLDLGFHIPRLVPHGPPEFDMATAALFLLVLPQLPMTVGNAVVSVSDLMGTYSGKKPTYRSLAGAQGLANLAAYLVSGFPLCFGAGGLASHYKFGARTAGSNIVIGSIFLALALLLGPSAASVLGIIPTAILGVLLIFAGWELAGTVRTLEKRRDVAVAVVVLFTAIIWNLGAAFLLGLALAYAL
ncbi:MAG: putative sulfate/molybdate transporter, partial [Candidatus Hydrothermarchaeaceae archaeon]